VTNFGSVSFFSFGSNLTDLVHGFTTAVFPAWRNCDCEGIDNNGDNAPDDWNVDCARARISFDFKALVGTFYMLLQPSSSSSDDCGICLDKFEEIIGKLK